LPGEVEGRIDELLVAGSTTPVEYGQALLRLAPPGGARAGETLVDVSAGAEADDPIPEGCFAVASPIDGVFYRSPSPGAAPFVEPGSIVHAGSTLGLVEAMKSFNAVTYGGPGLPARAQVAEVRAADAADVRQGAVLFVVRPASGR
ncbi:MAG: acetyl-CoA carboxylase biotin carboxyl carrier protein, partial [Acidobacteriota bacterium]